MGFVHRFFRIGAELQGLSGMTQDLVELASDGEFGGRKIGIARGHGEALGVSHRGSADDLDRNVQITAELLHHAQLLVILLAEDRAVGHGLEEELGDYRCHAFEEGRAEIGFQSRRRPQ